MTRDNKEALDALDTLLEFVNYEVSGHATREECIDKIRAALQRPSVPEGYVLVPIEPTEEMLEAACLQCDGYNRDYWRNVYLAMVCVAPKPTGE